MFKLQLHNKNDTAYETSYVVCFHRAHNPSPTILKCFEFTHPIESEKVFKAHKVGLALNVKGLYLLWFLKFLTPN